MAQNWSAAFGKGGYSLTIRNHGLGCGAGLCGASVNALLQTLLQAPIDMNGVCLPLQLHLTAYRVLTACGDRRAATVLARARAELRLRSERIGDTTTRREYLQVAEHRALAQGS